MQYLQKIVSNLKQHDGMLEARQPDMQQHDTLLPLGTEASEGSALAEWRADTAAHGLKNSTAAWGVQQANWVVGLEDQAALMSALLFVSSPLCLAALRCC